MLGRDFNLDAIQFIFFSSAIYKVCFHGVMALPMPHTPHLLGLEWGEFDGSITKVDHKSQNKRIRDIRTKLYFSNIFVGFTLDLLEAGIEFPFRSRWEKGVEECMLQKTVCF